MSKELRDMIVKQYEVIQEQQILIADLLADRPETGNSQAMKETIERIMQKTGNLKEAAILLGAYFV